MTLSSGFSSAARSGQAPLQVTLRRGTISESVHRVHAVVCDGQGRVLLSAGDAGFETFIRSALKPFQALPFLSSGAADQMDVGDRGIAISCASHAGTNLHAREAFKLLWKAELDPSQLQCPIPPNGDSPLQHNCSGKHAAFLATSRKMAWPLDDYLQGDHPVQVEVNRRVAELLGLPADELVAARDDCGAPTLRLQLAQMALLYAHLGASRHAELEQISRAMLAHPDLVAGEGRFDTELMRRSHGQVLSKGGAEGIQCLSRIGEGLGVAIKVEDGSRRAKQAVALYLLRELEWLTPLRLQELEEQMLEVSPGVKLEVSGALQFRNS
ncbi:MAG: asparaginase [Parasynechococcus sp.]|nr:asparaginase [Synechococcus sp. AH-601-N23]MDA7433657.1 asparaginase [Synechococcus sp. AH-601-P18]MDA7436311.1 asparaginase [Synechococcus sp. AH-601-B19]